MDIIKLCKTEAIALIVVVMINQVILEAPKTILMSTGTGALLHVIILSVIAILAVIGINKLFKKFENSDIIDVSTFLGGKPLQIIMSIAYMLFFFIVETTRLYSIAESLKIIYFPNVSIIFISLFFIAGVIFAIKKGFSTISKVNLIITILSEFIMSILFLKSIGLFVPERLFPILGYGANQTIFANLSNVYAFQGIAYIMFILPLLKNKQDFSKINIIAIVIMSVYLFLSALCLLLVFPFIKVIPDLLSLYLLTRTIEYGSFLARIDALYIFFWILSIISYLSINAFLVLRIFSKTTQIKNLSVMIYSFCAILLSCVLLINRISEYYFLQNYILDNYFLVLIIISIIILILANLKQRKTKNLSKVNSIKKKRGR